MPRHRDRRPTRDDAAAAFNIAFDAKAQQNRTLIAQTAARLIAEHGISDWSAAKRKAAREVGLPAGSAMPNTEEIEQALNEYHALFRADTHPLRLRAQRVEALRWMRRLARWTPLLVGGVAAGWATEHSDIRLELVADDSKTVEMALLGEGTRYAVESRRAESAAPATILVVDSPAGSVRLTVVSPLHRRSRPRDDTEARLDAIELAALIGRSV